MTDELSLKTTDQMKRQGICGRHGRQVSKHIPARGGPGRSLWGTPQV